MGLIIFSIVMFTVKLFTLIYLVAFKIDFDQEDRIGLILLIISLSWWGFFIGFLI